MPTPIPSRTPSRRPAGPIALLVALALLLAGCAGGGTAAAPAAPEGTGDGAFPVTVTHAFGDTVVPAAPQRVVVVGYKEQDYLLALGVAPVGIRDWYGDQPDAVWPWARAALGDARPEVLPRSPLDPERIAALKPDLIMGMSSGMTQAEYAVLSRIAPTVAQPSGAGDFTVTWQQMTRTAGQVLGRGERAEQLVTDLEARIAQVRAAHPQLDGATSVFASAYEGQTLVFGPQTTAAQVLTSLGLTTTPEVTQLTDNAEQQTSVSAERYDLLDVDVAVWSEGLDDPGVQALLANPLYRDRAVHRERRELFLGTEANAALAFSSVLSLPVVLDEIVPALSAAADGDPATSSRFSAP